MKQFLDFLPLVVFFAFYKIYDIYAATAALIVATAIVLIYSWVRFRKVEKMALITFVLDVVFGGLTSTLMSFLYGRLLSFMPCLREPC